MRGASHGAEILGVGAMTPVGFNARTTAAAVRAGVTRVEFSSIVMRSRESLKAGFMAADDLPPLRPALASWAAVAPRPHQRILRLAGTALREAAGGVSPLPLLLALPEPATGAEQWVSAFIQHLSVQADVALDLDASRVLPLGRAGGLWAMAEALQLLATTDLRGVLVGGADSLLDMRRLARLDAEVRLRGEGPSDGFVPGEGAAVVWLARPGEGKRIGRAPLARLAAVGVGREEGHLYSDKPHRGDGLAQALRELFQRWPAARGRVASVFGGLNGESMWAKEWGVAHLRHGQRFSEAARMDHPVENIGDPGAALGPLMVVLSALSLQRGYRPGPALVWCSSDREERAAVIIEPWQE